MATGAESIQAIAYVTGIAPATVHRAARNLREADADLWPKAGKGGGKAAAHVEPRHLVNLVLALAVADPLHTAAQMVVKYRDLVFRQSVYPRELLPAMYGAVTKGLLPHYGSRRRSRSVNSLTVGDQQPLREYDGPIYRKLGDACEWIVGRLASSADAGAIRKSASRGRLRIDVTFGKGRAPLAEVIWQDGFYNFVFIYSSVGAPLRGEYAAPLVKRLTLFYPLLEMMADLWCATCAHRRASDSHQTVATDRSWHVSEKKAERIRADILSKLDFDLISNASSASRGAKVVKASIAKAPKSPRSAIRQAGLHSDKSRGVVLKSKEEASPTRIKLGSLKRRKTAAKRNTKIP